MGIWWKRANKTGAVAGMAAGLAVTTYYMIGSRQSVTQRGRSAIWVPIRELFSWRMRP
jgi:cation/acetate symporter